VPDALTRFFPDDCCTRLSTNARSCLQPCSLSTSVRLCLFFSLCLKGAKEWDRRDQLTLNRIELKSLKLVSQALANLCHHTSTLSVFFLFPFPCRLIEELDALFFCLKSNSSMFESKPVCCCIDRLRSRLRYASELVKGLRFEY